MLWIGKECLWIAGLRSRLWSHAGGEQSCVRQAIDDGHGEFEQGKPLKLRVDAQWFVICFVLTLATLVMGMSTPTLADASSRAFYGLCYGPFRSGQSPDAGIYPTRAQIAEDLERLRQLTNRLRLYGLSGSGRIVVEEASRLGFTEILAGIWLGSDEVSNARELALAADLAQADLPGLETFIVGSEVLLRGEMAVEHLAEIIVRVRNETGLNVAYGEIAALWAHGPPAMDRLAALLDVIVVHIFPFWDGVAIEQAPNAFDHMLAEVHARYPGKTVVIGESGWPAGGEPVGSALPSPANQAAWLAFILERSREQPVFFFEAFSEPWKIEHEGERGAMWGLYTSDGAVRPELRSLLTLHGPSPSNLDFERSNP